MRNDSSGSDSSHEGRAETRRSEASVSRLSSLIWRLSVKLSLNGRVEDLLWALVVVS